MRKRLGFGLELLTMRDSHVGEYNIYTGKSREPTKINLLEKSFAEVDERIEEQPYRH